MNYPGTLNAGPTFRSFSDKLMSARFCVASVLETGSFDLQAFLRPVSAEASRLVALANVLPCEDIGTLGCRLTLRLEDGREVRGELRDVARELAIDWESIDDWSEALWTEAGRDANGARRARDAVLALPRGRLDDLRRCLAVT
jgi:hypothetical protein